MFNFILADSASGGNGGGSSWIMLVVLGVLMVGMILMSIIPQRKRQKQAQEMMSALKKGDKVKTIGGFVGVITAVDNGNGTLDIDVSTSQDGSIVVKIDKSAIYTVMNPVPQQNFDESKTVDTNAGESVVTADDMEEDKKAKDKKAKKDKKKAEKEAEKEAAKAEEAAKTEETAPVEETANEEVSVEVDSSEVATEEPFGETAPSEEK